MNLVKGTDEEKGRQQRGEREEEQQWIWKQQVRAVTKILDERNNDKGLKLKGFPEMEKCKIEDVTQIMERTVDEHLDGLGCEENLLRILRDPGLEERPEAD